MPDASGNHLDTIIIGGGAAGLWLLDELSRAGRACMLIERAALGTGQTIASQGIIHGGLKYTLRGLFTGSAEAIRDMPAIWRSCLAGAREPNLGGVRIRAESCHLWQSESIRSRIGMIGAQAALRVRPAALERADRPAVLADSPGTVARLDEQVIDPRSFLEQLAGRNGDRLILGTVKRAISGDLCEIVMNDGASLHAKTVILTAGRGNAELRRLFGLDPGVMQARPLHMTMLRGDADHLPELNGHCVDGSHTRLTITSDVDSSGRRIWQVGGQIAEDGVDMEPGRLIDHARTEITAVLPSIDLSTVQWSPYRVDRAEQSTLRRKRPDDVAVIVDGPIITAWPTKLALVPRLADEIIGRLPPPARHDPIDARELGFPRPPVAQPPWEEENRAWT